MSGSAMKFTQIFDVALRHGEAWMMKAPEVVGLVRLACGTEWTVLLRDKRGSEMAVVVRWDESGGTADFVEEQTADEFHDDAAKLADDSGRLHRTDREP